MITLIAIVATGCKPVNVPDLVNVEPSQTAFLVPLEGDTTAQTSFDSEEFYKKSMVATKRIVIPKRWRQTGRMPFEGSWIPTMRVLVVERKPATRDWEQLDGGDQAEGIRAESKDSIGFIVGFNLSAQINAEDAAKFLYRYNNKPLEAICNDEIRARIESKFVELCAKHSLDAVLIKKQEIMDAVRGDVIPYFKERGISITTLGMKGNFTYEDKEIQDALNLKFTAEQARISQEDINLKNVSKAESDAKVAALMANPQVRMLKSYELQEKMIAVWSAKWDGSVPQTLAGGGSNFNMLFNSMPSSGPVK